MTPEIRKRAREYCRKWLWNGNELLEAYKLLESLKFESESDLDFEVLDFFYDHALSRIMRDAQIVKTARNYDYAYEWGKGYLMHYVGHYALASYAEHPALHTSKAYDIVIDKLIDIFEGETEGRSE